MRALMSCAVFAAAIAGTSAQAAVKTLVVDVTGIGSNGVLGDSGNTVLDFNLGASATVIGLSYNVTLRATTPSWLSEMTLYFSDSAQSTGVYLTPAFDIRNPGTATLSDSANLTDLGLSFNVGTNGKLRLEFFEDFDDLAGIEAVWQSGTVSFLYDDHVTVSAVPEPETYGMMLLGLACVGAIARRRRNS